MWTPHTQSIYGTCTHNVFVKVHYPDIWHCTSIVYLHFAKVFSTLLEHSGWLYIAISPIPYSAKPSHYLISGKVWECAILYTNPGHRPLYNGTHNLVCRLNFNLKNRSKYVHAFVKEYIYYTTGSSFLVETISDLAAIANVKSSLSVHGCYGYSYSLCRSLLIACL